MTEQLQHTRTGDLPGQRGGGPATSATSPAHTPAAGWDALPWRSVVRVAAARALLGVLAGLLLWSLLPLGIGWTPRVILSGSMEPRIHSGDVVVTREIPPSKITDDMVLTTEDPDKPGRTRTHRFHAWDDEGRLVTQGDANQAPDSTPVSPDALLGVGVLRVPYVGLPRYWIAERRTASLGLALAALSGLVLAAWTPRGAGSRRGSTGGTGSGGSRRGGGTGNEGESQSSGRRSVRRAGRAGAAVTSMVGAVLSVALVAPGSHAAFGDTVASAARFSAAAQFVASSAYADAVRADGPSLHWRLDEQAGGAVADASGNANAGSTSGATWGRVGAVLSDAANRALGLDGSFVQQGGTMTVASAYSVELWLRTTRTDGGALVTFMTGTSSFDRVLYLGRDGRVRFGAGSGPATLTGTTAVNDGRWHHVVVTSLGSGPPTQRGRVYVDGVQQASARPVDTGATGRWRAGHAPFVGQVDGSPAQYFRGDLDEVAVYSSTLSAGQVLNHYRAAGY